MARIDFEKILVDADVDAANLALLTGADELERENFFDGQTAIIDPSLCINCGLCMEKCMFDAISKDIGGYRVDEHSCEGCKVCKLVCPEGAVRMETTDAGVVLRSGTPFGILYHGSLSAGRDNSGKMVTKIREKAREAQDQKTILIDGPPGIGCQTIAAMTGVDFVLVVTEPSKSAIHDMKRLFDLIEHFKVPSGIFINRYDINLELTEKIHHLVSEKDIAILGSMKFDRSIYTAVEDRRTPFDISSSYRAEIVRVYEGISDILKI